MHVTLEREDIDKWPAATKSFDDLQCCQHHSDRLIEMFCEDHSKLCCSMCLYHEHRLCVKLVLIKEKSQAVHDVEKFHEMSASIVDVQQELKTSIDDTQECLKKLQDSYDKAWEEIKVLRKKINDLLDELERNTIHSLDTLMQTLKQSLQSDTDKCSEATDDLNKISEAKNNIRNDQKDMSFIAYQKALEMVSQAENLLKELTVHRSPVVTFKSNPSIYETLSGVSSLGNIECAVKHPEKHNPMLLECKNKAPYNIKTQSDKSRCDIRGICELPGGDLLIADWKNEQVKLLDAQYEVVAYMDLPASPSNICIISPTEVVVTIDGGKTHSVQFLSVNNRQIVKGRVIMFKHKCVGISNFKENLFISTRKALYQYTIDGKLVKKIYEDKSSSYTVNKCAVSADGSRLYVTDFNRNKLLTLSMDGTVLSSLEDPGLIGPAGVHVSETGQLLVCGSDSHNVVQVDGEGPVVTLASRRIV